jgi:fucose 4-O-acetylase-like acetyltransferase
MCHSCLVSRGSQSPTDVIAARTPSDRDRWADALRAGSLLVVVIGHWLMVVVSDDGQIGNTLALVPALQPLTWVLQVMPLFFLVGGVAHAHTLESQERRGGTRRGRYAAFLHGRAARLLRPTLAFLAVWLAFGVVADRAGWTAGSEATLVVAALVMVPQLLWFVGIYLGVAALAPAMWRLHRRWGLWAVVALAAGACLVDAVRFGGGPAAVGNLNFALVWLALHQVGFSWRDGRLTTTVGAAIAVGGAVGLVLAVTAGPYPVSMVGLPGADVSNMSPPTVALLAQGFMIIGVAALARGPMARVLDRPRVWAAVVGAGRFAMTAFLWHLTALLVTVFTVRELHLALPAVGSAAWWWSRPVWFLVLLVPTAALVAIFVRFDRGPRTATAIPDEQRPWVDPLAAVSAFALFFGILMVSIVGVDVLGNRPVFFLVGDLTPGVAFVVLLAGMALLRVCRPRTRSV